MTNLETYFSLRGESGRGGCCGEAGESGEFGGFSKGPVMMVVESGKVLSDIIRCV